VDRVETRLPPRETSPATARAFVRDALHAWELDDIGAMTDVLTTELVSNVVRHVRAPMTVRALRLPSSIRVEIDDPSSEEPVARLPDPLDDHGRGLLLIASLAHQWGVTQHHGDGKTVWFEIDAN
jgi:hypothetical protein